MCGHEMIWRVPAPDPKLEEKKEVVVKPAPPAPPVDPPDYEFDLYGLDLESR